MYIADFQWMTGNVSELTLNQGSHGWSGSSHRVHVIGVFISSRDRGVQARIQRGGGRRGAHAHPFSP